MQGILLFGHGARNPDWARPAEALREAIRRRCAQTPVELGFLELMRPTFDEAVGSLVDRGVAEIVVIPMFMASGRHLQRDLPQMAAQAMERHPGLTIALAAPVGEAPPVVAAMAEYALDALRTLSGD